VTPRFGCVVLTQGDRPDELRRVLGSIAAQRDVEVDVVVVGNGWLPTGLPAGVKSVGHRDNLGIPAGRNSGVASVDGDFLVFVDDDACLPETDVLSRLAALFAADPSLGLVQPRFADPDGRPTPRHWVPRLRKGDPAHSSDVVAVCEAVVVLPRPVYDEVGGWPETFWYAHEGIDLAWRVWDSGHRVRYVGDIVVHHPVVVPQRHADFYRYTSRNRVLLARRHLPLPVGAAYLTTWILLTVLRAKSPTARVESLRGFREGFRAPAGPRRPIRWRTIWRMTRAGRPPVI
jgi:GT2 family glycosyltransferase